MNIVLHGEIYRVVKNQLAMGKPKEVRETLERLINSGYSRHEAIHKIGTALVEEIHIIMKTKKPSDEKRYISNLKRLK